MAISSLLRVCLLASLLARSAIAAEQKSVLFQDAAAVISFNNNTQGIEVLHNTSVLVTGDRVVSIFPASQKKHPTPP